MRTHLVVAQGLVTHLKPANLAVIDLVCLPISMHIDSQYQLICAINLVLRRPSEQDIEKAPPNKHTHICPNLPFFRVALLPLW